jgi:hypothetical protein
MGGEEEEWSKTEFYCFIRNRRSIKKLEEVLFILSHVEKIRRSSIVL